MTIAYKELGGSPKESIGPEGMRAHRELLCCWKDRYSLAQEALGDGWEFGTTGKASYPTSDSVVAMRVNMEPFVPCPDSQTEFDDLEEFLNTYETGGKLCRVTIDYELLNPSDRDGLPDKEDETFLTYRQDFGGEYITIPGHSLFWEAPPNPAEPPPVTPEACPTIRVPIIEHHISWHRVVNPPWTAIRELIGTVNDATFCGEPAQTVLFDGCTASKEFIRMDQLLEPQFAWRMDYVFRVKTIKAWRIANGEPVAGWNHCYRSLPVISSAWDRLVDAFGNYSYALGDFSRLFLFAASP